jgi:hypothetical protein
MPGRSLPLTVDFRGGGSKASQRPLKSRKCLPAGEILWSDPYAAMWRHGLEIDTGDDTVVPYAPEEAR